MSQVCQDPQQLMAIAMDLLFDQAQCDAMVARQRATLDGSARGILCSFAEYLSK